MKKTVNINIIIPKDLHRKLKLEAIKRGITLKQLALEIFKRKSHEK